VSNFSVEHNLSMTCSPREGKRKLKYLLPPDDEIAGRTKLLAKPYPNTPQAKKSLRLVSIQEGAV
jgi:hypothetical protein